VKWQPYLKPTTVEQPFLLARLVSSSDSLRRAMYVDAKLDTGSARSCVPRAAIEECRGIGVPLDKGYGVRAAGAFDGGRQPRQTYWFHLTLCPAPAIRDSLTEDLLRTHFRTTRALYPTVGALETADPRGLEMPVTERPYVVIGHDVLANWTVILHGRSAHFKVLDRGGRWFILSLAPR